MVFELSVFPLDNSPGFIIHRLDMQMAIGLQRTFQVNGYNITAEQWGVLNRLWEAEGIHQSALAEKTSKDRHNITRILNLLEKKGFLHRIPDSKDRRCFKVFLTDDGRALRDKLIPITIDYLQICFKGLTKAEIEEMLRIHQHILRNLES